MISEPKSMRNAKTDSDSSSTWTTWMTSSTRIRFQRSKPVTSAYAAGSASGSSTSSRQASSSGVPRAGAQQERVVDVVVGAVHLLGQPHQQEADRERREQQHDQPQRADGEVAADLPHLGVDEQERDDEQQQRQRPGRHRQQEAQAAERAGQRPADDRPGVQRGQGVPERGQPAERDQHRRRDAELVGDPGERRRRRRPRAARRRTTSGTVRSSRSALRTAARFSGTK